MKLKFYWIKSIYIILGCVLLQAQSIQAKNHNKANNHNYLIDRDVKDFPKIVSEGDQNVFQLISHGKPGQLLLNGQWRNASEIVKYLTENQLISKKITHLNIYGCSFAKGVQGARAIAYLQQNLHLSVAASSNITGANGDWILEVGKPIASLHQTQYRYNLQALDTADFDNDGIKNWRDLDDDNDGVKDDQESTCTSANMPNKSSVIITSDLAFTYFGAANIQRLVDGIDGGAGNTTYVVRAPAAGSYVNNWFKFELPNPTILDSIELGDFPGQSFFTAASTYAIEGSNDNTNWISIVASQTYTLNPAGTYATNNSAIFAMPNNIIPFKYYRIRGISGAQGTGWAQEFYFRAKTCTDLNTDGDALVNRLDIDSDGDGCSDAFETGATKNPLPNFQFGTANVGANGLADSVETAADNGIVNYLSTYSLYTTNDSTKACLDTDGDGVVDVQDIDDDNDGTPDVNESTCTASLMPNKSSVIITSELTYSYFGSPTLQRLVDGVDEGNPNTTYVISAPTGPITNAWFKFELPTPTILQFIELGNYPSQSLFFNGSIFNIDGSYDNITWNSIVTNQLYNPASPTYAHNNSAIFNMQNNVTPYKYYRIKGVSGSTGGGWAQEFYFQSITCTDINTDGDLLVNRLDPDSDGDGCSDALEAGATNNGTITQVPGAVGNNGLVNSLETVADNATIRYSSSYLGFALTNSINACADSDGDGIPDIRDIDDDNDGVPDVTESTCSNGLMANKSSIKVSTEMTYDFNGYPDLQRLLDGVDGASGNTSFVIASPVGPITNTWLQFAMPAPTILKSIEVANYPGQTLYAPGSVYNIDGSFDNITWTTLVSNQVYTPVPAVYGINNSNIFSIPNNTTPFSSYRIKGVSGSTGNGWAQEAYFVVSTCTDYDTDGDTLVNRLDLDSDNDGCSDALEGNATADRITPNFQFTGNVGIDGLKDSLETSLDNGIINYSTTYGPYARNLYRNACLDTDNDGITDALDIDDDNDGITDENEMSCKAALMANKSTINITSPSMTYTFNGTSDLQRLVDGADGSTGNTSYVIQAPTGPFSNTTLLQFELPDYTVLKMIEIGDYPGQLLFSNGSTYNMQGSNDGQIWLPITANQTLSTNKRIYAKHVSAKFYMNSNSTSYKFYRIQGVSGNGGGGWAQEIYFLASNCTDLNSDGDGLVNRLDLDSDNDGCSDALEGGATNDNVTPNYKFTGAVGTNGLADVVESVVDFGNTNYALTYVSYALDSMFNTCLDSDNDGIVDSKDIDDDNDGITDEKESYCSYRTITTNKSQIEVTSQMEYSYFGNPQSLQRLVDGIDGDLGNTTYVISAPTGDGFDDVAWLEFDLPEAKPLTLIELGNYDGQTLYSLTSTYNIDGSNDNLTWTNIVSNQTWNNTPRIYARNNSTKFVMSDNKTPFRYYRIQGINGTAGTGWAQEAYFQYLQCKDYSSDTDGVVNRLDLDSDNDGCSDALEGGSTIITTANYKFTTPVGTNGLANSLETVADNGNTNYTLTYAQYATDSVAKACIDSDNDGITDAKDIDDDNDGITDEAESRCTYKTMSKTGIVVSSEMTYTFFGVPQSLQRLVDNIDGDFGNQTYVASAPTSNTFAKTWLEFELPSAKALRMIELGHYDNQYLFSLTSVYNIQGSNDDYNWITIAANQTYNNTAPYYARNNSAKFLMPDNDSVYRFYRIQGVSGAAGFGWAQEAYFQTKECTDVNTDGDLASNRLDLDSDDDGCSDALEGGSTTDHAANYYFTTPVGANGLANSVETSTESGNVNYTLTYLNYAMDSVINACMDFDLDSVLDVTDIDDDNDGILDQLESACVYREMTDKTGIVVTSQMTYAFFGSSPSLQRLVDNVDGDLGNQTYVISAPASNTFVGKTWLEFELPSARALRLIEIGHYDNQYLYSATSVYNIQGSNDNFNWRTIVANQTYANTTPTYATNNSAKLSMPDNDSLYRFYRIVGVSGTAGFGWAQEAYFQTLDCTDLNSDDDASVNRLDLDSDNDGCADAQEGGATSSTTTNYQFTAPVGANGLADAIETAPENGIVNYTPTYRAYALDSMLLACKDFDSDGISDAIDIDDDNDGVLDQKESYCSYQEMTDKSGILVTSQMRYNFFSTPQSLQRLVDNTDGDLGNQTYVISAPTGSSFAKTWLKFELPFAKALRLIELGNYDGQMLFSNGAVYNIEGSNDNVSWTVISANQGYNNTKPIYATNNSTKFNMQNNTSIYKMYRIQGVSGTAGNGWAQEAYFQEYVCTDAYTDADSFANRLDLDADNDGCSDAMESGATASLTPGFQFTTPVGPNGLANSLETSSESGVTNYFNTYNKYSIDSISRACLDSDNDGITDNIDIDDDNDGVTDVDESNCLYEQLKGTKSAIKVTSQMKFNFDNLPRTLQRMVDGIDGDLGNNTYVISVPQGNFTRTWFKFELPEPATLTMIELGHYDGQLVFAQGSQYMIQGSNDNLVWDTIVGSQNYFNTPPVYATNNSVKFLMPGNDSIYKFYRIQGLNGSSNAIGGHGQEFYFQIHSCYDLNTDSDALSNRLDLESDGDGCSDALEGGSTTSYAPNYQFTTAVGPNGLANSLETGPESGATNYPPTYVQYALDSVVNACEDFDNDGITDIIDIDDDNDGVLDVTETNCSLKQLDNKAAIRVTSQMGYNYHHTPQSLQRLVDGVDDPAGNNSYAVSVPQGSFFRTWFEFELPSPQALKLIELGHYPNQYLYAQGSTYSIQASNDNYTWDTLAATQTYVNSAPVYATNNSVKFAIPSNNTYYKYYRIHGISGSANAIGGWAQEAYFQIYNCTDLDTDGDGIPNRHDLNSDDDVCSDAYESGATTNIATDYQFTSTVSADGMADELQSSGPGGINYTSTYSTAMDNSIHFCDTIVPLPLHLVKFSASLYQQSNGLIEWQSQDEAAGTKYVLEKSADGKVFSYLYAVDGKGTQSSNNYNYIDPNLYNGNNFYRLKMIETGDKVSYTNIRNVRYDTREPWATLSPNPTSGLLTFEFVTEEGGDVSITIDNIIGQRVLIKQVTKAVKGKNIIKLDVYGLTEGVYLFNYQIGDQPTVKTIKFNKVLQ